MVGSVARDALCARTYPLWRLGAMLRRSHLASLVLSCALRLASVAARAFNSIWRGVSSGCDPTPFGWFPVGPGSRPYSFGTIVGVVSASLHASLYTSLSRRHPVRTLMLTVCSGWLAGRMVRAHYGMPCLGAVLDFIRVVVRHALHLFWRRSLV